MNEFKCDICGKFIAYKDINKTVDVDYTPDTEYTIEEYKFIHKNCKQK